MDAIFSVPSCYITTHNKDFRLGRYCIVKFMIEEYQRINKTTENYIKNVFILIKTKDEKI